MADLLLPENRVHGVIRASLTKLGREESRAEGAEEGTMKQVGVQENLR